MVKKLELGFTIEFTTRHRLSFGLPVAYRIPPTHRRGRAEQVEVESPMSWKTLLGRCFRAVDSISDEKPKLVAIAEEAKH